MDYQKSTTRQIKVRFIELCCTTILIVVLAVGLTSSQSITNNISITAIVPSQQPSGGGGGGGGGGSSTPSGVQDTGALFRGVAYPGSIVSLLQNGRVVAEQPASPDASFSIGLYGISSGTYVFALRAQDANGRQSALSTYTILVTQGATTVVRGIFLAPTVAIDKQEVRRGDILTVLGKTVPNAQVTVVFNSETQLIKRAIVDSSGNWTYKLNTLELEYGDHQTKARAESDFDITPFSQSLAFKVGTQTVLNTDVVKNFSIYDLNKDGKVNLVDFSMLVYWYRRPSPPVAYDFNKDTQVGLADLSMMIYHWTG